MKKRNKKELFRWISGSVALVSFAGLLVIVSAIEQGAGLANILWGAPLLAIMAGCAEIYR